MDPDLIVTILKWTAGVLAAGFIAQFGKRFADWLIERRKSKKEASESLQRQEQISSSLTHPAAIEMKAAKKEMKAAAKLEKKRLKKGR